uniref:Protein FAM50 homolog n=1 Tax=Heterorhabditis bacteriophora TaxID=37862 RepID=A0A1I7XP06_HETBA
MSFACDFIRDVFLFYLQKLSLRFTEYSQLKMIHLSLYRPAMSRADAGRLIHLSKKRERAKEDMEQQMKKMEEESSKIGKCTYVFEVCFMMWDIIFRKKEELAMEWRIQQEREKNEEITVAYAYWDGSSHRKNIKMKKGHTISQFLTKSIEALKKEFTELKTCISENLMFVKEDLIIPHFYT